MQNILTMKLNISYPLNGNQNLFETKNHRILSIFYDKRIGSRVQVDALGKVWKDYILEITGGSDKQGFPMKKGVLTTKRVRLLLAEGQSCYHPRRDGQRRRKLVRGCIVADDLSVLSLKIVRRGDKDIPGLTDAYNDNRLGPKRANKIRALFNLPKTADLRDYVKRAFPTKNGKKQRFKAPKIQRLITPMVLQRKRRRLALKKQRRLKRKLFEQMVLQRQKKSQQKKSQM